ncbi:iron(III) transport system substrate-binding protein [Kitasatospora sp. MAP12-15]|uniref:extracellular solute-binding protein n=1 Tax=unclassified Kitasatospora TaxID=2633591 RepID=UPI00247520D2|nr:extracellular solute-binding protein [Kitasatospora sp. MAP12-44]MDH6108887.1 iron(III) transport system substrate-binding protein [Kitasatospora sp. MAP12-44]
MRRPAMRSVGLIAVATLAAAVLTGCSGSSGSSGSAGSAGAQTLTLYNGQHEQTTDALVAAFTKKTGIKVSVRSDDEDVLANQIEQEGSHAPADLFYTENSPALMKLQGKNMLAPVDKAALAQVPAQYDSPQGDWIGVSARVSVLIYNTKLVTPAQLPTSITQLSDPQWKGKLALAQGETDFQPIVTSLIKAHGADYTKTWLTALKNNAGSNLYPGNENVTSTVNSGKAAIGVIDQYYWYRLKAENKGVMNSAIAAFAPQDPGYVLDVSGAGILASSKHQAAAQQFIAFLGSAEGQQIIATSDSFEYPIGSGVTTAQPETPLDQLKPTHLTVSDLGDGSQAVSLLQQAQLL